MLILSVIFSVLVIVSHCDDDPGEALFLTPLIESGNVSEARDLSSVHLDFNIESYAGYFTVNEAFNSNLFFWFFPALNGNKDAPVLLWLQGGPGASSLFGLFVEIGPIAIDNNQNVVGINTTWAQNYSLLFIDNPVGSGFSFTDSEDGYAKNETMVGNDLYSALLQFFELFPELKNNPFFIAGESYAGKYIPAIAYTIHINNPNAEQKINFQGAAIGNGLCDPINQLGYGDFLYQVGIIDKHVKKIFDDAEEECRNYMAAENWDPAFECFDRLVNGDTTGGQTLLSNYTHFNYYFNFLYPSNYIDDSSWGVWVVKNENRRAIHVGNRTFSDVTEANKVENYLKHDMVQSVVPWIVELLNHYPIMFYNGQLDIIVAYALTVNFLGEMKFSAADEYATAERLPWFVNGGLAGYIKSAGNLTEVMVRDAGHMVPWDQPYLALDLITQFITNHSIPLI